MTLFVGGAIIGAVAGTIGYMASKGTTNASTHVKSVLNVLNSAFPLGALLTAPVMDETVMQLGAEWGQTLVDEVLGVAVVLGGSCAVVPIVAVAAGCCYGFGSLWSRPSNTGGAEPVAVIDIEAQIQTEIPANSL